MPVEHPAPVDRGAARQARIALALVCLCFLALGMAMSAVGPALPELAGFFSFFSFFDRFGYTCETPDWLVQALGRRRTFDEGVRAMYGAA